MYNQSQSIILNVTNKAFKGDVTLPSSKSICNRVLIVQSICNNKFNISNISNADDSQLLVTLLDSIHNQANDTSPKIINTKNAGTVFRFLTAYLSICKGSYILTGDNRMQQRPIHALVNALLSLGADIKYLETHGFPPLQIGELKYKDNDICVDANLSSQFISALLLIAPLLPDGIKLYIKGNIVSRPYIDMTLKIMQQFNVQHTWHDTIITVRKQNYLPFADNYIVEADWSAASYFYQIVAMADDATLFLKDLYKESFQGDSVVADIFKSFGVDTVFEENGVRLTKNGFTVDKFKYDFSNCPDLVPAVAVTCAALGILSELRGLKNLKIKESDRLTALYIELSKMGVETMVEEDNVLWIYKSKIKIHEPIQTYNDHRMAMCFAPLALLQNNIELNDPDVVVKSFPDYFKELCKLGFEINE
ncbi:MAG: 3-phosphoshikimate 1-carboxyvinyltransferase [Bacteroidota bacterium]